MTVPRSGWVKPESDRRLSDLVSVGVLTRVFPPALLDEVIAESGRTQVRPGEEQTATCEVRDVDGRPVAGAEVTDHGRASSGRGRAPRQAPGRHAPASSRSRGRGRA